MNLLINQKFDPVTVISESDFPENVLIIIAFVNSLQLRNKGS